MHICVFNCVPLTSTVFCIHACKAFHRSGQNAFALSASKHFINAASPDSLLGNGSLLNNISEAWISLENFTVAVMLSSSLVYNLAISTALKGR